MALDHGQRRPALRPARGLRRIRLHDEPVPVLYQRVPDEAELGGLIVALAIELRVRVRGRFVRIVAAPLAVELDSPFRPADGGSSDPSLARKLLSEAQASTRVPSTEKCSA